MNFLEKKSIRTRPRYKKRPICRALLNQWRREGQKEDNSTEEGCYFSRRSASLGLTTPLSERFQKITNIHIFSFKKMFKALLKWAWLWFESFAWRGWAAFNENPLNSTPSGRLWGWFADKLEIGSSWGQKTFDRARQGLSKCCIEMCNNMQIEWVN